jgi:hypothetical protein
MTPTFFPDTGQWEFLFDGVNYIAPTVRQLLDQLPVPVLFSGYFPQGYTSRWPKDEYQRRIGLDFELRRKTILPHSKFTGMPPRRTPPAPLPAGKPASRPAPVHRTRRYKPYVRVEVHVVRGPDKIWNEAEINRLEELRALGYSGGQIATVLNRTRNSIIGKLTRMGLTGRKRGGGIPNV